MLKLRSRGRGRNYSALRGLAESLLDVLYTGDWPVHLGSLVPGSSNVREIRRRLEIPSGDGPPCRIAFASDLHVGPTTARSVHERLIEVVTAARPDVLLLGGDFVFLEATPSVRARLTRLVATLPARTKLAVLGNHDLWTHDEQVVSALEEAGAAVLVNQAVRLPAPWSDVVVVGLDDPWTGSCDASRAFAGAADARYRVVLCHSPDGLLQAAAHPFDVYLCGHTHGGQVAAPWGPIVLPKGAMCRRFPSGFQRFGTGEVFVSRGVGTVDLPVRLFATPDVLMLDLERGTPSRRS